MSMEVMSPTSADMAEAKCDALLAMIEEERAERIRAVEALYQMLGAGVKAEKVANTAPPAETATVQSGVVIPDAEAFRDFQSRFQELEQSFKVQAEVQQWLSEKMTNLMGEVKSEPKETPVPCEPRPQEPASPWQRGPAVTGAPRRFSQPSLPVSVPFARAKAQECIKTNRLDTGMQNKLYVSPRPNCAKAVHVSPVLRRYDATSARA
ncbi:unnamed protein product [Effrenium voratum]|uniref:Uncharacterized protein n=1 Tax=Effrenium voratum TaxID=2562239 RepID=A0AA36HVM8_9DINO|nr:unnamed protein product [Effrenium voratum]CAJ1375921.1 unnamed protein product [Effrenium voratum]CAJ1451632.1 unnamed protein product [Effrenium voratum]